MLHNQESSAPSSPPIHVVVPAYGASPYLTETLESLVRALPNSCPLAVQDDASPGDEVERQVRPLMPRVEYWRNERNLGVSGAFNAVARRVQTPYFVLVGPDDRAMPHMLDAYQGAIEAFPSAVAIHPGVVTIDGHGERTRGSADRVKQLLRPRSPGLLGGQRLAASLLVGNWTYNPAIAWSTVFVRRCPFDERLHTAMDLDLLLRLAFAGQRLALADGLALEYRRHSGAVSSVNAGSKRLAEELEIHGRAAAEARAHGWTRVSLAARLAPTARLHGLLLAIGSKGDERRRTLRLLVADPGRSGRA